MLEKMRRFAGLSHFCAGCADLMKNTACYVDCVSWFFDPALFTYLVDGQITFTYLGGGQIIVSACKHVSKVARKK